MATTFGEQIKQLALTMDHIDGHLLEKIMEIIEHFLNKSLNIQNAKVGLKFLLE